LGTEVIVAVEPAISYLNYWRACFLCGSSGSL